MSLDLEAPPAHSTNMRLIFFNSKRTFMYEPALRALFVWHTEKLSLYTPNQSVVKFHYF